MKLLAKSNGTELLSHCKAVSAVSAYLAERLGADAHVVRLAALAGLLHDIGKADPAFQAYMHKQSEASSAPATKPRKNAKQVPSIPVADDDEHDATPGLDVYHNELGYAAMSKQDFYKLVPDIDEDGVNVLQQAVLWHHACRELIESLPPARLQPVLDFAAVLLGSQAPAIKYTSNPTAPATLFARSQPEDLVVRTCLIAADHIVSSLSPAQNNDIAGGALHPQDISEISDLVRDLDSSMFELPAPVTQRDRDQLQCATHDGASITQVNAPTGFGKTRVGVMRTAHRKRRTLWVCPRNTVAEAVYANIVEELEEMKRNGTDVNVSVELYLTSKRQKSHGNVDPDREYTADVIVTNIDMLLTPMVRNGLHERAYLGLFADVIMDEYHEFVMKDSAIFAACHNLLQARAQCSVTHTMCLSATPSVLLAGIESNKVDYLPAKGKHYPAVHSKPYRVHLHAEAQLEDLPDGAPGSLVMLNSVRNAQKHYQRNMLGGTLVHSKYTDADRASRMTDVLTRFGKHGNGRESENFVVSGPVLQAALNISFRVVHLSSSSAEADMQAARTNRFGEMDRGEIHLYNIDDRGESAAIETRWSRELQTLWFDFLVSRYGNTEFEETLDGLYRAYNDFYTQHELDVRRETDAWCRQGAVYLTQLAPRRYSETPIRSPSSRGPSKPSLRDPDGSLYILVRRAEDTTWLPIEDAFSVTKQEFSALVKAEPWLSRESDRNFVLSSAGLVKAWKNDNGSSAERKAANRLTPFPTTKRMYDRDLGLVRSEPSEAAGLDMLA